MGAKSDQSWLKKGYWAFATSGNFLAHFFLLIVRVYWGAQLVLTGFAKYSDIQKVEALFTKVDIPYPLLSAYIVGAIEFFGGIFLILGLFSRLFAFLISVILITALVTVHSSASSQILTKPELITKEAPFLFLYTTLIVFCFGPGAFSIDYWLEKKSYGAAL
jgi:putative oxidoreductase